MLDDHSLRWAEALAIERLHGDDGPRWIAQRIQSLSQAGDAEGAERFTQIALRYAKLLGSARRHH